MPAKRTTTPKVGKAKSAAAGRTTAPRRKPASKATPASKSARATTSSTAPRTRPPGKRTSRAPKPVGHEVSYSGRIFRSKLEARWAAYLDLLHINWDYEPSHYQVGPALWYLPDFYLPDLAVWLEVKGLPFMDAESMTKVLAAVAGPQRIPLREAPYSPAEHLLLGGSFLSLPAGATPVHTLVSDLGAGSAGLRPVKFNLLDGCWMLEPVGPVWDKSKATGVKASRRPAEAKRRLMLEPSHHPGEPHPFLASAYTTARRLRFDDASKTLGRDNPAGVIDLLSRRRAGRPLAATRAA